jgi:hypothetical protein
MWAPGVSVAVVQVVLAVLAVLVVQVVQVVLVVLRHQQCSDRSGRCNGQCST